MANLKNFPTTILQPQKKRKDETEIYKRPIIKTAPFYIYTTDGSLDGKFCLLSLNVRQFIFAKGLTTRHLPLAPLKL